jgi:putative endonuclease
MTNESNSTLYTGVTSDFKKRLSEHRSGAFPGSFTFRYKLFKCVYYEGFHRIEEKENGFN